MRKEEADEDLRRLLLFSHNAVHVAFAHLQRRIEDYRVPLVEDDALVVEMLHHVERPGIRRDHDGERLIESRDTDGRVAMSRIALCTSGRPPLPRDLSSPKSTWDVTALFSTAPPLWALLMMNAVPRGELDVASLHRLRPQHAEFTLHRRMHWLLGQGLVKQRRQGLVLYYALNPEHRLYRPLKRLLDRIGKVWPDMVAAAKVNDDLKPARRLVQGRNARRRAGKT